MRAFFPVVALLISTLSFAGDESPSSIVEYVSKARALALTCFEADEAKADLLDGSHSKAVPVQYLIEHAKSIVRKELPDANKLTDKELFTAGPFVGEFNPFYFSDVSLENERCVKQANELRQKFTVVGIAGRNSADEGMEAYVLQTNVGSRFYTITLRFYFAN